MNLSGTLTLNNRKAHHAKSWSEATPAIAKGIAPFVLGKAADELNQAVELSKKGKGDNPERIDAANQAYIQIAAPLLWKITQSNDPRFWSQVAKLQPEHYAMIIGSDENPVAWCFNIQLTRQLFPTIRHNGKTFFGPRDYFKGMTFAEYLAAQARYSEWTKDKSIRNLAQFFGVLYRPERTDQPKDSEEYANDARKPLILASVQQDAKAFEAFSEDIMLVAILYWQGSHAKMRTKYPFIFRGTSSKQVDPGVIVIRLAKSPGKDDVLQIQKAPLHNIMRKLNDDAQPKKK